MLTIIIPFDNFSPERNWILDVFFNQWSQVPFEIIQKNDIKKVELVCNNSTFSWPDILFQDTELNLTSNALDIQRYEEDIAGYIFLLLTRQEEWAEKNQDNHKRFSATYVKGRDVHRPVVDEKFKKIEDWLIQCGAINRSVSIFNFINLSCDIDWPLKHLRHLSFKSKIVSILLKLRDFDFSGMLHEARFYLSKDKTKTNPYNQFEWMNQISNTLKTKWKYFVISKEKPALIDGNYSLDTPGIKNILDNITNQGHLLGIHFSYNSFNDQDRMLIEQKNLQSQLNRRVLHSRQHYLRWNVRTPRFLSNIGIQQDASMGFADSWGYRAGTSRHYTWFDLETRKSLPITIAPLILMDSTLFGKNYLNLSIQEAELLVSKIIDDSRANNYPISILIHNHLVERREIRRMWSRVLKSNG